MLHRNPGLLFLWAIKEKVGKKKSDLRQMGVFPDGKIIFVASRKWSISLTNPWAFLIFPKSQREHLLLEN
jgi:hypothetical protein